VVHRIRLRALPPPVTIVQRVLLTVQGFLALLATFALGGGLTRPLARPLPEHIVRVAPRRRLGGEQNVLLDHTVWAITFSPSLAAGHGEHTAQRGRISPLVPFALLGSIVPVVPPTSSPVRQALAAFAPTELAIQVERFVQLATSVLVVLPARSRAMRRLGNIVLEERLTTLALPARQAIGVVEGLLTKNSATPLQDSSAQRQLRPPREAFVYWARIALVGSCCPHLVSLRRVTIAQLAQPPQLVFRFLLVIIRLQP